MIRFPNVVKQELYVKTFTCLTCLNVGKTFNVKTVTIVVPESLGLIIARGGPMRFGSRGPFVSETSPKFVNREGLGLVIQLSSDERNREL